MGKLLIDSINLLDRPVIVAYLLVIVTIFIVINLVGRRPVLGARSARAADGREGMSSASRRAAGCRCRARRAPSQTPVPAHRRATSSRTRSRCSASRCSALIVLARALRAAHLAAEPVRPRAARRDGQPAAAGRDGGDRRHVLARHRRPGPRHAVGDLLRPAHLLGVGAIAHGARARASASTMGLTAAYVGGRVETLIMRIVDIQLSFPAILIALILIAVLGQGTGKVIAALVTIQWAYYARTVRSAALVEKRKEYMEAARCLALSPVAHRLPAPAAELPAAADRRRDRAGRRGDRARGDAVVPRPRAADHRAVARPADRQRLPVPAVGQVLDQLLPRRRAAAARSSASTSSPTSCATCSIRGCSDERRPEAWNRARVLLDRRRAAHALLHQGRRREGGRRRVVHRAAAARCWASSANRAPASR